MSASLKELIERGFLSTPVTLYGEFGGHEIEATLKVDASLEAHGQTFNSLSVAAGFLITVKTGRKSSGRSYFACNGWRFWNVRDAHGMLLSLDDIRRQAK